jgi:ABC-2 type transport system ATP-binding protein
MRQDSVSSNKLLSLVGLGGKSDASLDELSQGMRQRLSLAVALMGSPKVLLLDEPFNGLDPVAAKSVEKMIQELSSKGV